MIIKKEKIFKHAGSRLSEPGFTLVEILVAMVIALVVMAAIYSTYQAQQRTYITQEQVSGMQQNMRAGIYIMTREIRMAGYDPEQSGLFGITDVRRYDIDNNLDVTGNSKFEFTADLNDNGTLLALEDKNETISFSLYDPDDDGVTDLARNSGAGRQLLGENIEALGFAYAYDNNGDDTLDTSAGDNVIWAVDTDNDNQLDLNLDTDDNGVINEDDDTNSDGDIEGVAIGAPVPLANIRAVKIWLLARTDKTIQGYADNDRYVVGHQVLTPGGAFMRRLITASVKCRNL